MRVFIVLVAALMAVEALGIDIMLPALPRIAHALAITNPNQQQWIVTAYLIAAGVPQLFFGPLSDSIGRRKVLFAGLVLYSAMSLAATLASGFGGMIAMRMLQGLGAAALPVTAIAMVRDRFSGAEMARVMSTAFMVFMVVPILAPSLGGLILTVLPWQGVFGVLALVPLVLALLVHFHIPETLPPSRRRPLELFAIIEGFRLVVSNRASAGYTAALAVTFGALIGYVACAQQLFTQALGASERIFPVLFAAVASGMVFASFLNSRIVMRLGTARVSHTVIPLYILVNTVHLALLTWLGESLVLFVTFQFAMFFCIGIMGANFGAMAMEAMGEATGTAAAVQGMTANLGGSLIGMAIGQFYDGTSVPLVSGAVLTSLGMLALVLFAERGRLTLRAQTAPA